MLVLNHRLRNAKFIQIRVDGAKVRIDPANVSQKELKLLQERDPSLVTTKADANGNKTTKPKRDKKTD